MLLSNFFACFDTFSFIYQDLIGIHGNCCEAKRTTVLWFMREQDKNVSEPLLRVKVVSNLHSKDPFERAVVPYRRCEVSVHYAELTSDQGVVYHLKHGLSKQVFSSSGFSLPPHASSSRIWNFPPLMPTHRTSLRFTPRPQVVLHYRQTQKVIRNHIWLCWSFSRLSAF